MGCTTAPVAPEDPTPTPERIDWERLIAALPERAYTEKLIDDMRAELERFEYEESLREWTAAQPRLRELLVEQYRATAFEVARSFAEAKSIAYRVAADGEPHSEASEWTTPELLTYLQSRPPAAWQKQWRQRLAAAMQTLRAEAAAAAPPDPRTATPQRLREQLVGTWTYAHFISARPRRRQPASYPRTQIRYQSNGSYRHVDGLANVTTGTWELKRRGSMDGSFELVLDPPVDDYSGWGHFLITSDSLVIDNSYVDGGRWVYHRVAE